VYECVATVPSHRPVTCCPVPLLPLRSFALHNARADEMQVEQERSYREAANRLLSNASHELRCVHVTGGLTQCQRTRRGRCS